MRGTRALGAVICALWGGLGCDGSPGMTMDGGLPGDAGLPAADGGVDPPDGGGVVARTDPPPPASGGTLLVTRDDRYAVAADSDRDVVWIVDFGSGWAVRQLPLEPFDEPGRLAEGADGTVYVALRRGGALVTVDVAAAELLERRPVCPAPRGVATDLATGVVHVACLDGDLVTLPAEGGPERRRVRLDRDLRDVIVDGDQLLVSRFRAAELLYVSADGSITRRVRPPHRIVTGAFGDFSASEPAVAWRTIGLPEGGALMLHQQATSSMVEVESTGYGGGACGGVVSPAVTELSADGTLVASAPLAGSALAIDLALSSRATVFATASVGPAEGESAAVQVVQRSALGTSTSERPCVGGDEVDLPVTDVIGIAYRADGRPVAQTREPAGVAFGGVFVGFGGGSRADPGHDLFHTRTLNQIACASCHPEGGEDGHVWEISTSGPRRTQSLLGGLLGTEPFHWSGDVPDLAAIMESAFVERMGGHPLASGEVDAIGRWLDAQRPPPATVADADAVARGAVAFDETGCASCHAGAKRTNNESADVGTGGTFQVPGLLGVVHRAPYMHDGCAETLDAAVTGCGPAGAHGAASTLTADQRSDLRAYLESI